MTIRRITVTKVNVFHLVSSYNVKSRDMYYELYINGEEISVGDMINHMFPYWKVKGRQVLMDKRYAVFKDPLLELKYINHASHFKVLKNLEMKQIHKELKNLYTLQHYGNKI